MASLEQLKQTFFDECADSLQQCETGLSDIRDGQSTGDTINAVFRAVHSIKGGAGIFGFEALVEFAHAFETALDAMRRGDLAAASDIVDVLLTASDILSDLVQMSQSGAAIEPGHGGECRAALERLVAGDKATVTETSQEDNSPAPADFEGIDFTPVRAEGYGSDGNENSIRTYTIAFRPKQALLKKANEPLYILRELRKLGELDLVAATDELPSLPELEADQAYIGWTGTLRTTATRSQIDEVFEFVIGDCELTIEEQIPLDTVSIVTPDDPPPAAHSQPVEGAASDPVSPAPAPRNDSQLPLSPVGERPEPLGGRSPPAKPAATTTRVELERIDRAVNLVGELVISQAMLGQIVYDLPEAISGRLSQILEEVVHHTRELKDSVMSMRAQPVGAVFQRMPRLVRELSAKTGKKVRLEMAGETTEVDRSIIERLADPLTHIIRNSMDHGIETPADRLAVRKSDEGTIRLAAEHRGGRIIIEISDDGAGINSERVLKKAKEKGLIDADAVLTEDEMNNLIFLPGFSTAETVSDISGRGVGMDVVRRNIQEVGGRINLKSVRGRGMTIQLALPLTLAVMDGMVIKVSRETYVMPLSAIVECLRPRRSEINNLIGTSGMLKLRGDLVPLVHLGKLLEIGSPASDTDECVVIISDAGDGSRFGLIVDELCGHQQVVIKSIEESYGAVPGIAAATILGNGRVAFILDVEKLADLAATSSSGAPRNPHRTSMANGSACAT